ncbi:MAG: protein-arginine-phosphatase [Candidatus Binatia bacterium]|nr:MAG: protein-arginine-phosphatase [Candidatus Binatia bacterium]
MDRRRTILLVCHANTCRSVIAAELLKRELARVGLDKRWEVLSGGIAPYARDGALVSLDARLVLREEGIEIPADAVSTDLKRHRELVARADLVLAMTRAQLEMLREHFPESHGKPAFTWRDFGGLTGDVEDPFNGGTLAYHECRTAIKACLDPIVRRLASDELALAGTLP